MSDAPMIKGDWPPPPSIPEPPCETRYVCMRASALTHGKAAILDSIWQALTAAANETDPVNDEVELLMTIAPRFRKR